MAGKIIDTPSRALSEYSIQEHILLPSHIPKDFTSDKVDLSAAIVKYNPDSKDSVLKLNIPVIGAAMQSVTGVKMAIALAKLGGLGVVFCSQPPEKEAEMIKAVKDYKAGFVVPDTVSPGTKIEEIIKLADEKGYSTFPVVESGKLVGYITKNDYHREKHKHLVAKDRMLPFDLDKEKSKVAVAFDDQISGDLHKAYGMLIESHHGSLPIVDRNGALKYVVFKKDVDEHLENPFELVDSQKRYIVGAAINTRDYKERVPLLVKAGADILFIDTSQGHTDFVKETLGYVAKEFSVPVVAGNIVTAEGFRFLVENNASAVKVGMGPGSICITQEQIGVGRGQATAIREVAEERDKYFAETGVYVPIIADGGVVIAKDISVALALGSDAVMVGRYIAGCDESPAETRVATRIVDGKLREFHEKPYWGEGSARAKAWMENRYDQMTFDEGVEATVECVGPLKIHLHQALTKIRDGIRKAGCRNMEELHKKAVLQVISEGSIKEGRAHDVDVKK
ncbi:MAG: IMP dehydrogenase [Candidatus Aenigmarchaeota archaeon]|nr:IMP dehydrogenase [Candidatus Aenigmarchaeota archaeon]